MPTGRAAQNTTIPELPGKIHKTSVLNIYFKLMPPLVIEDEKLLKGLEILKESIKAIL